MTATAEVTDDLDLGEYNPAAVEKEVESGGKIPVGKYHARLVNVSELMASTKGNGYYRKLTFEILAGPEAGRTHTENLTEFVNGATDQKVRNANNKYLLFASRLGMLDTTGGKYRKVKPSLADCAGAEVVIDIIHQPDKTDKTKTWVNLSYAGVLSLTDPKVKDVARAAPGDRPAAAAATTQPAGYDTSDL